MDLKIFIKERIFFILINIVTLAFSVSLLRLLNVQWFPIIFLIFINFIGMLSFHIYDYIRKKKYYDEMTINLDALDKKHLISDVVEEGKFLESSLVYKIISECNKSFNDEISKYKRNNSEYKDYIELWVHEIKTPISSCRLIIENNESEITKSIKEEINKIENYIEQSLFYARSSTLEKDYIIKKLNLYEIVGSVINKNADFLIKNKVKINIDNLDKEVYSDSMWLKFILGQIISNSIKYMNKKNSELKFYCNENKEGIILSVEDNGIGISDKDIDKVFLKGFTGENGRKFTKSTGMGLYICKMLCEKLNLGISIDSVEGEFTRLSLVFPINKIMNFS